MRALWSLISQNSVSHPASSLHIQLLSICTSINSRQLLPFCVKEFEKKTPERERREEKRRNWICQTHDKSLHANRLFCDRFYYQKSIYNIPIIMCTYSSNSKLVVIKYYYYWISQSVRVYTINLKKKKVTFFSVIPNKDIFSQSMSIY